MVYHSCRSRGKSTMRREKTRARYGTGDSLKLNKRECEISIELLPRGIDFLKIILQIKNDYHEFFASSAVGYQFSSLVGAIYQLYSELHSEGSDNHDHNRNIGHEMRFFFSWEDPTLQKNEVRARSSVFWDGEGPYYEITLDRKCKDWIYPILNGEDPIELSINSSRGDSYMYVVDGHDLCYAVAKAYTDVIKKYGFYGYYSATGGDCNGYGDVIDMHMILFIKAYALNALEVRKLKPVWMDEKHSYREANGTPFEKELELFLFDM